MKNYLIDYNKAAYADTILWTDEANSITDLEPLMKNRQKLLEQK